MPTFSLKGARTLAKEKKWASAAAHYFEILRQHPERAQGLKEEFLEVFVPFLNDIPDLEQKADFVQLAILLYRSDMELRNLLITILSRNDKWEAAGKACVEALSLENNEEEDKETLLSSLKAIKTHLIEQWHFRMLNDVQRNSAYNQALESVIKSFGRDNVSVLDIGSGTGLLSAFAAKAGATSIYACEQSQTLCELSREIFDQNSIPDVKVLVKHSSEIQLEADVSGKVDLIVTELMDAGFFGEGIVPAVLNARRNLLKEGGKVIPEKASVYGVIIEARDLRKNKAVEKQVLSGGICLNTTILNSLISSTKRGEEPYTTEELKCLPSGYSVLSETMELASVNFNSTSRLEQIHDGYVQQKAFKIVKEGVPDAIAAWFEADLCPGVRLSSWNDSKTASWEQAIFLLPLFETVKEGASIPVEIVVESNWFSCRIPGDPIQAMSAESSVIGLLNDSQSLEQFANLCESYQDHFDFSAKKCLDISGTEILPSIFTKTTSVACVSVSSSDPALLEHFKASNPELASCAVISSPQELEEEEFESLLVWPIDKGGLLLDGILEDIAYYRLRCNIRFCLPNRMKIFGQLVQSPDLEHFTRLSSNENTLGIQMTAQINLLKTEIQKEVILQTLNYTPMSEELELMSLDFNETLNPDSEALPLFAKQSQKIQFAIKETGKCNAVIVWHSLQSDIDPDFQINTKDPSSHFKLTAYMLNESVELSSGNTVDMMFSLDRSSLNVELLKVSAK